MLWTWLFSRSPRPPRATPIEHLPNAIRDEVLSICRSDALAMKVNGLAEPDCGCLDRG